MGLPNNVLSDVAITYTWWGRDTLDPTLTQDYEEGGLALNDTSQGSAYQLWTFWTDGTHIFARAPSMSASATLLTPGGVVTSIRGCFDQNMNPFVAYQVGGQWSYWWYDTVAGHMVTSQLPSTVNSVVCTLDDKRTTNAPQSDICLLYTNNGNLYYRRQRDRYSTEYLLRASVGGTLVKVCMNGIERLQIKMQTPIL